MMAITQRESVVIYIKSCLIFQIPRFMLISKYRVISPLMKVNIIYLLLTCYIKICAFSWCNLLQISGVSTCI